MKVGEIEDEIMRTALALANHKAREKFNIQHDAFKMGTGRREGAGPFVLEINDGHYQMIRNAQQSFFGENMLDEYKIIAAQAVHEAIMQHKERFAEVVGTMAVKGENYFDAFN